MFRKSQFPSAANPPAISVCPNNADDRRHGRQRTGNCGSLINSSQAGEKGGD